MKPFATFSTSMLVHGHLVSTDFPAFVCISGVAARRHATAAGKGWPSQQTSFPQILRLGFCLSLAPGTPPKSIE